MEGRNYTSAFRYERRLYGVFDLQLPRPATFGQVGVWAATLGIMLLAAGADLLPLGTSSLWLYIAIPFGAGWAVNQPGPDRRPLHRWLVAQVRYLLRPRRLDGLKEKSHPERLEVVGDVYSAGRRGGRALSSPAGRPRRPGDSGAMSGPEVVAGPERDEPGRGVSEQDVPEQDVLEEDVPEKDRGSATVGSPDDE